ncbi:MAG TPA: hypothetical protein VMA76_09525 [Solirubrobacteraceae bacterium]|nr:hypothetical protein [Solirubrobacteraceae bacterium]
MARRLFIGLVSIAACALIAAPADATTATVAITGGGLTMTTPSVRVIGQNPTVLEATTTVTDARGTGSGWVITLGANSADATSDGGLVVFDAKAACVTGSACTLPINRVSYPLTASLSGTRTVLFEAAPSSGMGALSITARVMLPASFRSRLDLSVSLSAPPLPDGSAAAPSFPCSVETVVTAGRCREAP